MKKTDQRPRVRGAGLLLLLLLLAASQAFGQAEPPATCRLADNSNGDAAATQPDSLACGQNATADGIAATAVGATATASGDAATAIGANSLAITNGTAVGSNARAAGDGASAFGTDSNAGNTNAVAIGFNAEATGENSIAVGANSRAIGTNTVAIGNGAVATVEGTIAIGANTNATGSDSVIIGWNSTSNSSNTTIVGARSTATGQATILGNDVSATNVNAIGIGRGATIDGSTSIAIGNAARISFAAEQSVALGHFSAVADANGTAIGNQARVDGTNGTAVGQGSRVLSGVDAAAAFGVGSIADRSNAVSFGNASLQRQLIYVAAGTADTDGVNVAQLKDLMQAFGAGANYNGGIFGAPTFVFASGDSFRNVNDALLYLDGRITRISLTPGPQGPAGPTGPTGPTGPQGPAGTGGTADCDVAVCYDDSTRRTATLNNGGAPTRLQNVDAGVRDTDAVNLGQMRAADLEVLNQANSYTDNRVSNILTVIDDRFEDIDAQLNRGTAINTAMTMMASSAAGVRDQNRIAVGVGASGSEKAIAAGYQRAFDNGSVATFGVSYSGGETTAGFGFGFGF